MPRSLPVFLFAAALAAPLPCFAAAPADGSISLPDGVPDAADVRTADAKAKTPKKPKKGKMGKKADPEPTPAPPPPDADEDGVIDADDKCVEEAEDKDGFEDKDGCPDPDNDGDGVLDADDGCPDEAENKDGWDDEDGCPEAPSTLAPMSFDATLNDGTKIKGTLVRIVAVDEDDAAATPHEPEDFAYIVNDEDELRTSWANLRELKADKVVFTEAVDCYSEGVQDLGDDSPMWECTLKNPTVLKFAKTEKKGTARFLDRKMERLDLKLDDLTCDGPSCASIEEKRTLSVYPYRLLAQEKNEDEFTAVSSLQTKLRAIQAWQIKTGSLQPKPASGE